MNSRTNIKKIGSDRSHRKSLISNLSVSLILHEHMTTTVTKSKAVIPFIDRLFVTAKKADENSKRRVLSMINNNVVATAKVFSVLMPRLKDIKSGFINVYKVENRKGDNAQMVKLMIHGYEIPKKKGRVKQSVKKEVVKEEGREKTRGLFGGRLKFGKSKEESKANQSTTVDNKSKAKSRSGI